MLGPRNFKKFTELFCRAPLNSCPPVTVSLTMHKK